MSKVKYDDVKMFLLWKTFCNRIYEHHFKEIGKLKEQEKETENYYKDMTELEYKIFMLLSLEKKEGGKVEVNLELTQHKDFIKVWDKFMKT